MSRQKLPIGIHTFRKLREEGCYYVDKTEYMYDLIGSGDHNFLSRPRRFGKSLFLDTLKELFEGNEELFKGLAIHDRWDWSNCHPVVLLSFGGGNFNSANGLESNLLNQLSEQERVHGVISGSKVTAGPERLGNLIKILHERSGRRVVVLVDEYDKPVTDALNNESIAECNRDYLYRFFGVLKENERDIRFTFITGVTILTKVSLFSGLNHLRDITLDSRFSAICGYTERDLDHVFKEELPRFDRDRIREWYNGYSWSGEERVYNPFEILLLFDSGLFRSYWLESGSTSFLYKLLFNQRVTTPNLAGKVVSDELLSRFEIDDISIQALLFQTGYLTIESIEEDDDGTFYRLGYPNREVRQGLNRSFARVFTQQDESDHLEITHRLRNILREGRIYEIEGIFHTLYAGIPNEWYRNNDIERYEGYYASVFYSYLAGMGSEISVVESTNLGRTDLVLKIAEYIYIFEFKIQERTAEGDALKQIKNRDYAEKFRGTNRVVYLVGIEFSSSARNIVNVEIEKDLN